ncbi:MAG: glycine cleavage system aminomethyltransferase GcvT [Planctomycetota bacterium]|nr:glycine cleavage system aminomethyltransferase GcvT [Planctomycetota bacterium]
MTNIQDLQTTPLYQYHITQKAKMVDFTGWDMPLHYGSIIEEHIKVRRDGGFFDVSHMGRIRFKGLDSCRLLDRLCSRQIHGMQDGQIRYSLVCNENGGCKDDVLIYRFTNTEYLMVCNGANREKILSHIEDHRSAFVCSIKDETESTAMIAIQGPNVMSLFSSLSQESVALKSYRFITKNLFFAKILISRTGYTGEDGVEVILPEKFAQKAIGLMTKHTKDATLTLVPTGLGARDSLRLEAGMPLYGHELTEETDPISAGLNFAVQLEKGIEGNDAESFVGQDALQTIKNNGSKKQLIGLRLEGRRSPRQYMKVFSKTKEIGEITSGCFSPTFNYPIAMAYISSDYKGEQVEINFGKSTIPATIVPLPFYKRST